MIEGVESCTLAYIAHSLILHTRLYCTLAYIAHSLIMYVRSNSRYLYIFPLVVVISDLGIRRLISLVTAFIIVYGLKCQEARQTPCRDRVTKVGQ